MTKIKAFIGLSLLFGSFAVPATDASALFQQIFTPSVGNLGPVTITIGTFSMTCAEAPFEDQVVEVSKQAHTKLSPHHRIFNIRWTNCTFMGALPATLTGFEFQEVQNTKGQTKGFRFNIVTAGAIEVPSVKCIITVPNSAANQQLKESSAENSGTEALKGKAKVGGITETVNKSCEELGVTGTSSGEFIANEITDKGDHLV